jgi:hypothetical protein
MNNLSDDPHSEALKRLATRSKPSPDGRIGNAIRQAARSEETPSVDSADKGRRWLAYVAVAASVTFVGTGSIYLALLRNDDPISPADIEVPAVAEASVAPSLESIDAGLAALRGELRPTKRTGFRNPALQRWRKRYGPTKRDLFTTRKLIKNLRTEIRNDANKT